MKMILTNEYGVTTPSLRMLYGMPTTAVKKQFGEVYVAGKFWLTFTESPRMGGRI